ncbi:transposase domain-containing protein [Streptomyces sp. NPDC096068]|uniref:transposase domain-containing protein n=1 Tax=Streptomyces sp. NPDC096068 TaxID=3155424 RepID=UPI00332B0014
MHNRPSPDRLRRGPSPARAVAFEPRRSSPGGWRDAGQCVRIGILTKAFTAEPVDAAIAKRERVEQRRRLPSARLVVYFAPVLRLFARESYEEVLRVPTSGTPGAGPGPAPAPRWAPRAPFRGDVGFRCFAGFVQPSARSGVL